MLLIVILITKKREQADMENIKTIQKKEAKIDEEMIIHQALEKAGAMPAHHHREEKIKKQNIEIKNRYHKMLFYIIAYTIIAVEIWYLYKTIKSILNS
jgi:hypothetical protein